MLYQVIEDGRITESYSMPDHDHTHHINRTTTIVETATLGNDEFETVLVDATLLEVDVYLPHPEDYPGRIYHIKKIDSTAHDVVIHPWNPDLTIDDGSTLTIHNQWECYSIQNDGTTWYII